MGTVRTVLRQETAEKLLGVDLIPEGVMEINTEGRALKVHWVRPRLNLSGHWIITAPFCEPIMILRDDPLGLKRERY
jgi:hypothetical protein